MPTPILVAKQYIPDTCSNLVLCPRLIKCLNQGLCLEGKLTLISIPAGFGKTIGVADRSPQKTKCGTVNDESYAVFVPHAPFRGDKV